MGNKQNITLVIGGCRSGKSDFALERANALPGDRKIFLATSVPRDREMEKRVEKHVAERGDSWITREEPVDVNAVIDQESATAHVILLDCLTLWTTNLLMAGCDEAAIREAIHKLALSLENSQCPVYLVTNEVGYGIVPENTLARQFRDHAGLVNRELAKVADEVYLTVAGIDLRIKPQSI